MSLGDVVDAVADREKTLTVINPDPTVASVDEVAAALEAFDVTVRAETTETGRPDAFVVLEADGRVVAATDLEAFVTLPSADSPADALDAAAADPLWRHLADVTFEDEEPAALDAVAARVVDRALDVGEGTLRLCAPTAERVGSRLDAPAERCSQSDLDVHLYVPPGVDAAGDAAPDVDVSELAVTDLGGATIHRVACPGHRTVRLALFEASDGARSRAIVACSQSGDGLRGFQSSDPAVLDRVLDELRATHDRSTPER